MAEQATLEVSVPPARPRLYRQRVLLPVVVALYSAVVFLSCSDDKKSVIQNVDPEIFPTMLTTDVSTFVSDSGYTRYHLTADLWLMFDDAKEPHWTFPDGIFMEKYDDNMNVNATFRSDSASYLSQKRIWQFDGDVRMKNTDGDRFATEQLFWNQQTQKVYSDSFIHIERVDRILEGYGFISNEQMTEYTILNVSGIFPTPERKEKTTVTQEGVEYDSLAAVQDTVGTPQPDKASQATPPPVGPRKPGAIRKPTEIMVKPSKISE